MSALRDMRYRSPIVTYRWFIWGLSNGVFVLVIAGGFWFGLAASTVKPSPLLGLIIIFEIAILWAAVRLRRKARGFRLSEAKHGDDVQRELRRELLVRFRRVAVAEGVAATVAVGFCVALNRKELMWAALGLVVSLHFAPLARIFRLWLYYGLATLGSLACILAMVSFTGPNRILFLGATLGATMWLTAVYAIVRADRLAEQAVAIFASELSKQHAAQNA